MKPRQRLSDILSGDKRESVASAFDRADEAEDFQPLPVGDYTAHLAEISPFESRSGTPGVKMTFRVCDGAHAGRLFWSDLWLTEAAMPMTKRDLGKLGIKSLDQLDEPLPALIRCECKLSLRRDDDGNEFNRLKRFEVVGVDEFERDAFAPADDDTEADTSFDVEQLEAETESQAELPLSGEANEAAGNGRANTAWG